MNLIGFNKEDKNERILKEDWNVIKYKVSF